MALHTLRSTDGFGAFHRATRQDDYTIAFRSRRDRHQRFTREHPLPPLVQSQQQQSQQQQQQANVEQEPGASVAIDISASAQPGDAKSAAAPANTFDGADAKADDRQAPLLIAYLSDPSVAVAAAASLPVVAAVPAPAVHVAPPDLDNLLGGDEARWRCLDYPLSFSLLHALLLDEAWQSVTRFPVRCPVSGWFREQSLNRCDLAGCGVVPAASARNGILGRLLLHPLATTVS